jgi:hypothetical protein
VAHKVGEALHVTVQGPDCHDHSIKIQNSEIALNIGRLIKSHRTLIQNGLCPFRGANSAPIAIRPLVQAFDLSPTVEL